MGPCRLRHGNKAAGAKIVFAFYGFNGAVSVKTRKLPQRMWIGRFYQCFNGAVSVKTRKCECPPANPANGGRFNGAVSVKTRKSASVCVWLLIFTCASMGPCRLRHGNSPLFGDLDGK